MDRKITKGKQKERQIRLYKYKRIPIADLIEGCQFLGEVNTETKENLSEAHDIEGIATALRHTLDEIRFLNNFLLGALFKISLISKENKNLTPQEISTIKSRIDMMTDYLHSRKKAFDWAENLLNHRPDTEKDV